MKFVAVPKKYVLAAMRQKQLQGDKAPSFWDVTQWPRRWEEGAKILEKSAPGKIVTAPVRIIEAATGATTGILKEAPKVLNRASWTLPILGVAAVVIGSGYLVYKFKKDKKEITKTF